MAWSLEGQFYENCSCTAICPCTWSNMNHVATNDYCRAALCFSITNGDIDGVDVSGCKMLMLIDTPPNMAEGNWTAGLIIDDSATEDQANAWGQVMSGTMGGPPEALGPLLGNFLGVEMHPISVTTEGGKHHVTVGDQISYVGVPEINENGEGVELRGVTAHPASDVLVIAPVETSRVSAMGIEFGGEDLSGFTTNFNWTA
jgi:hypothetical protein